MQENTVAKTFTANDFLDGTEPYDIVYQNISDGFQLERAITQMSKVAQNVGIRNFKKLFGEYVKNKKQTNTEKNYYSTTQFEGQTLELNSGEWQADESGITTEGMFGEIKACSHPIMPVERLINIDTGIEKLKIAYRKSKNWRSIIVDKKTLAGNNTILDLANYGISVTSETSKYLVKYLQDMENLNYDYLPEKSSVSRLGWIEGEGFSPYVDSLVFDGDINFRNCFESVRQKGGFDNWLDVAQKGRDKNIVTKITLAASFAAPLIKPLNCLPFFVHLWGGTEVGKTVGLMLAASVWGHPDVGKFIQSFNSTMVGRERMAAFFNNMPLIMDELQVIKDKKSFDHDIYTLCEGAGKVRGNKNGGTDQTPTWANCIITNGEMPITTASSGGGAVNRILEIECKEALFDDPQQVCSILRKNHGIAGKKYIEYLQQEDVFDHIHSIYKGYHTQLSENDTTQKQAIAAAAILTADKLISDLFFHDKPLEIDDIKVYLQTKKEVSNNERGYQYMCDWVTQNANKFSFKNEIGEIFGKILEPYVYIISTVFHKACSDAGFNGIALLSYLSDKDLIKTYKNRSTVLERINGIPTRCICLKIADEGEWNLPF